MYIYIYIYTYMCVYSYYIPTPCLYLPFYLSIYLSIER